MDLENDPPNNTTDPDAEVQPQPQADPQDMPDEQSLQADITTLKLCHINVNGWTQTNQEIRKTIIEYLHADIICLSETHLSNGQDNDNYLSNINVKDYTWFGNNRNVTNVRAPRPSGGVGILLKRDLLVQYNVHVVDKTIDGIIAIKIVDKVTEHECVIICAYLPPENSTWGRDAASFYSHVLQLLYVHNEADALFLCGDLNSRIGQLKDYNDSIDSIPPRTSLDNVKNMHGEALIEFLRDSKCCVLNGRLCPDKDKYTCVSNKGKSVVDYIIVPHDVFDLCHNFEVLSCETILDNLGAEHLVGDRSRCPDHAVVSVSFNMYRGSAELNMNGQRGVRDPEVQTKNKTKRKFNFSAIPEDFLSSHTARSALIGVIDNLSEALLSQSVLDSTYENLCKAIIEEMNNTIPYKDVSSKERKWFRNFKPFWTQELSDMWKEMVQSRKSYEKYRGDRRTLNRLRAEYKDKRNLFDKRLRQEERKYKRGQMLEIESLESENPNEFWERVQKLGPRKSRTIPMEVVSVDGEVKNSEHEVLQNGKTIFITFTVVLQERTSLKSFMIPK